MFKVKVQDKRDDCVAMLPPVVPTRWKRMVKMILRPEQTWSFGATKERQLNTSLLVESVRTIGRMRAASNAPSRAEFACTVLAATVCVASKTGD